MVTLVLSGWTLKYVRSGTVIRLTLFGAAIFYFLLFYLREGAITYLIPLALFNGFTGGNYRAAFNLNQYIYTSKDKRIKYFGTAIALINVLQAIGPLIGGAIITYTGSLGYSLLFLLVSLILGISAILIGRLPQHEAIAFKFRDLFAHRRSIAWKYVLSLNAVSGLFDVALGTVTGVLIYLIVKKEVILGATQTGAFLLGALGSMIAIQVLHKSSRYYWIGV
mgnify:CR=1 FL=1